jgi:two-component system, chemotaxis family, sensor kinase CheA
MTFDVLQAFLPEAEELLASIEEAALALTSHGDCAEPVNSLFRAFHTLKGSGSMAGLDALAAFTHHVENLLDQARGGAIPVTDAFVALVLASTDHSRALLHAARDGQPPDIAGGRDLATRIEALAGAKQAGGGPLPEPAPDPAPPPAGGCQRTWKILFRPHPMLMANGSSPLALMAELRGLGDCEIAAHAEDVPVLNEIQPDRCYIWWTATLRGTCDRNAIRDVFVFVEDDSHLEIEEVSAGEDSRRDLEAVPAEPLTAASVLPGQRETAGPPARQTARDATVRVPAERLDRLVNLVGEFVMNQSCLAQAVAHSGGTEFSNTVQALDRLVGELRDTVLGIRMLPIGTLFGRFLRLVHDLSLELGKEADLITAGAETELDKSILEQLGEPLIHCLRNCLDHGIEPAAERAALGKPRRATIRLSAAHTGSSVLIRIEDDGRGIDREAVRLKAVERKLLSPDAAPGDEEILNLILLPGFSTAREVTSVSGRGVGMDAVKRQVDALRGTLSISSPPGKGTAVSITLPLTLAIIDGLLVEVAGEQFIIPMAAVTENVELRRAERERYNGRPLIPVRGELVPYIDLRRAFQCGGEDPAIAKVVLVQCGSDRAGLAVDRVLGSHQTVIQSLGRFYRNVEVASGATIMGDGRVALILDVAAVVRHAGRGSNAWRPGLPASEERAVC